MTEQEHKNKSLKRVKSSRSGYSSGIGYIFLPNNVEREDYVKDCFRTNTISFMDENGQFKQNCPIDRFTLQQVDFPEEIETPGSSIVYVLLPVHEKPIIIACIDKGDESELLNENEFRLLKSSENGIVSISGRGDKGELYINVDALGETKGVFNINVGNGDLNVEVDGKVNLKAADELNIDFDKDFNITSQGGGNITLISNNTNIKVKGDAKIEAEGKVYVKATQVNINDGNLTVD